MTRSLLAFTACLLVVGLSGCLGGGGGCAEGDEGCACYPNDTCNDGLVCLSSLCVDDDEQDGDQEASDEETSDEERDDTDEASEDDTDEADSDAEDGTPGEGGEQEAVGEPSGEETDASPAGGGAGDPDPGAMPSGQEGGGGTPDPATPGDTPVARHGQLRVFGTRIVDEQGVAVQLKGASSMWLNWEPTGYAESLEGLRYMRDNWGLTIIRAAMGVAEDGAYLEDPNKAWSQVRRIVENAVELGVYVLVDWHDHEAEAHQSEAQAFFAQLSEDYGDLPNILYEVYNEPLDVSWSSTLRPYHEAVAAVIRERDPDNIIILGTPNWSQDVDVAAGSPVSGNNLMYTLHFYSCTHGSELRGKGQAALNAGLPLFVTEWGATHADGGLDGVVCESEAAAWHDWMDDNGISWTAWKLDGCEDSTCYFTDRNVPVNGNWTASQLNGHAPFVIERMQRPGAGAAPVAEPTPTPVDDSCTPTGSCAAGDGLDCRDGELVTRDCGPCGVLSCGVSCCDSVGYFAATSIPDFEINMDLVTAYEASSSAASIAVDFDFGPSDEEQLGVIAFKLDGSYDIDPAALLLELSATNPVQVSLEGAEGEAGCVYDTYEVGGLVYLLSTLVCWGDFDLYSPVEQINVRLQGVSSGAESMTVTYISW